jgi:DNA-binding NtrC family response regulator
MIKILIVDDEMGVRELVKAELEEKGYQVFDYDKATGLLDVINDIRPDAVILDIKLEQGFNDTIGLDLLQEIRNKYYDMPVIIYSAYDSFKYNNRSISATYYVVKSYELNELVEKLDMALAATGIEFSRLHFGKLSAERDILSGLDNYFLTTNAYNRIRAGDKTIILGSRGTGKTAIFQVLKKREREKGSLVIEILPEHYSYEILSDVMLPEGRVSWAKQSAYTAAWKYVIYIEIMKKLNSWGRTFKTGASAKIYNYLRDKHYGSQGTEQTLQAARDRRSDSRNSGLMHKN